MTLEITLDNRRAIALEQVVTGEATRPVTERKVKIKLTDEQIEQLRPDFIASGFNNDYWETLVEVKINDYPTDKRPK